MLKKSGKTMLKKSGKTYSPSLFIGMMSPDHPAKHVRCSRRCHKQKHPHVILN